MGVVGVMSKTYQSTKEKISCLSLSFWYSQTINRSKKIDKSLASVSTTKAKEINHNYTKKPAHADTMNEMAKRVCGATVRITICSGSLEDKSVIVRV